MIVLDQSLRHGNGRVVLKADSRCVQTGELSELLVVWSLLLAAEVIQSIMQVCCAAMPHF